MTEKKEWINKLHKTEVKILDEFVRVCDKNNLDYFFTGGTLIGAVRHKGFIPWDDDIDVGMTRKDFDKFVKACQTDLKDNFYLDYYEVDDKYFRLYAKLKLKNTLFIENDVKDVENIDNGIWIDIFPYENIEEYNTKKHVNQNKFRLIMTKLINRKSGMKNYLSEYKKKHKIIMLLIDFILKIIPRKVLLNMEKKKISSCKNDNSKYISCMSGALTLDRETHLRDEVFPVTKLEFEGKKYKCPKEYDKLLTKIYGDYMKLPPVEKRITHNPYKILFEDGEELTFEGKNK